MTTYVKLGPLDYSVIEGVRHWPCADGNVWVGVNTFTSRENLLADWLDRMKQERDDALMKIARHECIEVLS